MTVVRRATDDDAARLAELAERTFRDTFAAVNDPDDIDAHCRENFGTEIQHREILDPDCITLLAEYDGELIAYAQLRLGSAKDCVAAERPAELHRIYVAGAWQGRGVAQAIMAAVLQAVTESGADSLWLGVWEENPKAIAFYRKYGFEVVGDHVFQVGADPQRDLVMAVDIAGRSNE